MRAMALLILIALLALATPAQAQQETLLIALMPAQNIFKQVKDHRPLEAYLQETLGVPVKITVLTHYPDMVVGFGARGMQGAFFDVFTALRAMEMYELEPLARMVDLTGEPFISGLIITRKDSGITSVDAMSHKRMAFVDNTANVGYVFARAYLREKGIMEPERFFSDVSYTGSPETTAYMVHAGRADLGAISSDDMVRMRIKDPLVAEELAVLAQSAPLPDDTLFIRKDMDAALKKRLLERLLALGSDGQGKQVLRGIGATKFIRANANDYKQARQMVLRAGLTLRAGLPLGSPLVEGGQR